MQPHAKVLGLLAARKNSDGKGARGVNGKPCHKEGEKCEKSCTKATHYAIMSLKLVKNNYSQTKEWSFLIRPVCRI